MSLKKPVLVLTLALSLLIPALAFAGAPGPIVNTVTVTADNQVGGADAATATNAVIPGTAEPIPTLSQWGLVALVAVLGGLGVVMMRRRAGSAA